MVKEIKELPNDTPIDSQKFTVFSFITPENVKGMTECAFMFRGAFPTIEEAKAHAKHLQEVNGDFNIFVGEGFKWMYFNRDLEKCTDVVYKEERLNEIMQEYKHQNELKEKMEKERQTKMIEEMEKDNKVQRYNNSDNPDDKIKLTLKEKMEKLNLEEIKKSEDKIVEAQKNIDKLKEADDKL